MVIKITKQFSLFATALFILCQPLSASNQLDKKLTKHVLPLKKFSYHFEQDKVIIKDPTSDNTKGKTFLVHIPRKTPVVNLKTNVATETTKPLNVKVFMPHNNNKYAFLLDKEGKAQYRTEMSLVSDLAPDLDLLPRPKIYTETQAQLRTNEVDNSLAIETSLYAHLGVIQSDYFTNFGDAKSAFSSGFGAQAALKWQNVRPLILIDYASYSLRNKFISTFATWKYGLGLRYIIPYFKQETSISLTVLGALQYKAVFANNNFELSSNAIRFGIQRVSTATFADFTYGIDFEKEQLAFVAAKNLSFSSKKESVYTVRAHIGLNFDFTL